MLPQFDSCNSRISALVAAERLFSSVDEHVSLQISNFIEGLVALFTIVLFLSTVGEHMLGQIA